MLLGAKLTSHRLRAQPSRKVPVTRVPEWEHLPGLVHGFSGRAGGVSRGPFAELNLSFRVGDDSEAVQENWRRMHAATGAAVRFTRMRQVHGAAVVALDAEPPEAPEADALVTGASGLALSVLTADCVPILLVAPRPRAIAAVHAGWRGTLAGVVERTVAALRDELHVPPQTLYAALGPAIGGCCYEVEASIVDALEARWGTIAHAVRRISPVASDEPAKAHLDLRRANATLLERVGVPLAHIVTIGPCTSCAAREFFSYRAANGTTGRQLSFIAWHD